MRQPPLNIIRQARKLTDSVMVGVSGGKDSVHEDSSILVRVNGEPILTTPKALLPLVAGDSIFCDGQWFVVPKGGLEILSASTLYQKTATPVFSPVRWIMHHDLDGSKDFYEITSTHRKSIRVTGDHSVMVMVNSAGAMSFREEEARNLSVGDSLVGVSDFGFDSEEIDIPDWLLRLGGLWIADGCHVYSNGVPLGKFVISTGRSPKIIEFLKSIPRPLTITERAGILYEKMKGDFPNIHQCSLAIAKTLGSTEGVVYNYLKEDRQNQKSQEVFVRVKTNGDAWICNKKLTDRLKTLGFVGKCREKRVPEWMYSISKRQIGLFLAGYFDGDGCVRVRDVSCSSISKELLDGIRQLLWRLGIKHGLGSTTSVGGFRTKTSIMYSINIGSVEGVRRFKNLVPTFKAEGLPGNDRMGNPYYPFNYSTIKSIKKLPSQGIRVFDFEVKGGTHTFVADGHLLHNSVATLSLCKQFNFKRIAAYFFYIVPDLTFQERMLRYCEKRFSIKIYRLPHWALSNLLADEMFRGPYQGDVPKIMLRDAEDEARKMSGIEWIATGQRKDDSLERRAMLTLCQGINVRTRHFYPVSEWGHRHVFSYLRTQNIPISFAYRYGDHSIGCGLREDELGPIKKHFPEDFAKIVKRFPFCESILMREEIKRARREQASVIQS